MLSSFVVVSYIRDVFRAIYSPTERNRPSPPQSDTVAKASLILLAQSIAVLDACHVPNDALHTSIPTYFALPVPFLLASSCGHCTRHLSTTLLSMVPLKLIFFTLAQDST